VNIGTRWASVTSRYGPADLLPGTWTGQTILILPGLGTCIDFWQLNIPALARDYHVVAVDPPGFGKSAKPRACCNLPGWPTISRRSWMRRGSGGPT